LVQARLPAMTTLDRQPWIPVSDRVQVLDR
jgi:hypothetical protein